MNQINKIIATLMFCIMWFCILIISIQNQEFMYMSCTWVSDTCFKDPTWLQELLD